MIEMSLSRLAQAVDGRLIGEDRDFAGVSTDSRKLGADNLFVALCGERFDGHAFIGEARNLGAAGALVSKSIEDPLPMVLVPDTLRGLGQMASYWRQQFQLPVLAVTGSNGKTTVKEMIAAILRCRGVVMATMGNFNNEIGVPLTLSRLSNEHRYAVVEMGANHPGEIKLLTAMAKPDVALITNAAAAHLEGFGSLEGVARAKGEIFSGLSEQGCAVINADDPMASYWRGLVTDRTHVEFGFDPHADVRMRAGSYRLSTRLDSADGVRTQFVLETPQGDCEISLALLGEHNVRNALAAGAAALAVGASLQDIQQGLAQLRPVAGRFCVQQGFNGCLLIDDTYNANPGSLQAALDVTRELPGQVWLVLGDMGELGPQAAQLHAQMGRVARQQAVARMWLIGAHAADVAAQFGPGAQVFADIDQLVAALRAEVDQTCTVLVKGSRFMRMERVVNQLRLESVGEQ